MDDKGLTVGAFTTDAAGRIDSWNTGSQTTFGYTASEAVGQPLAILFTQEDRQQGVPDDQLARARDSGAVVDERWHARKDGTSFWGAGLLAPLYDRGRLRGFVRTVHEARETDVSEGHVRRLLSRLITIQEDERRRIARDLHDHVGQQITALRLHLSAFVDAQRDADWRTRVEVLDQLTAQIDKDLSFLAWELRPSALDDLGLSAALERFVHEWSKTYGIPAEFLATAINDHSLTPDAKTSLYRIAQEALNNVHKHAQATRATVTLRMRGRQVVLIVEDNGVGLIDGARTDGAPERGLGLVGMRERAALAGGTVTVESQPAQGTRITAEVPLP